MRRSLPRPDGCSMRMCARHFLSYVLRQGSFGLFAGELPTCSRWLAKQLLLSISLVVAALASAAALLLLPAPRSNVWRDWETMCRRGRRTPRQAEETSVRMKASRLQIPICATGLTP